MHGFIRPSVFFLVLISNPIALKATKTPKNFGRPECNKNVINILIILTKSDVYLIICSDKNGRLKRQIKSFNCIALEMAKIILHIINTRVLKF